MTNKEAREILIEHRRHELNQSEIGQALDVAIRALGDGWIDVDVMPTETNYYTVYYMNQMDSGYRIVFFNGSRWIDEYGHEITDITHYQPLPSPPKS
jgi:hypothetical protein